MSTTYTKLFQSILDSTIWQEALATKVVWVTMLAMSDRDGRVWASVPGLAHRAGVSVGDCELALEKFLAPDAYSRTTEHEGRRIVRIDGGWELLNHEKYRSLMSTEERREYQRRKQAEYRARRKGGGGSSTRERAFEKALENGDVETQERLTGTSGPDPWEGVPDQGGPVQG